MAFQGKLHNVKKIWLLFPASIGGKLSVVDSLELKEMQIIFFVNTNPGCMMVQQFKSWTSLNDRDVVS